MGNQQTSDVEQESTKSKKHSKSPSISERSRTQDCPASPSTSDSSSNNSSPTHKVKRRKDGQVADLHVQDHPMIQYGSDSDSADEVEVVLDIDGHPAHAALGKLLIYNARVWVWDHDGLNR